MQIVTREQDIASIDRFGRTIRFFNPRRDAWDEHFQLQGKVTARLLRLNAAERVVERRLMHVLGLYRKERSARPTSGALGSSF